MWWPPPPSMRGPQFHSSLLVVAKNEDEMRGSRGRWAAPERATMMTIKKRRGGPGSYPRWGGRPPFWNRDGFVVA